MKKRILALMTIVALVMCGCEKDPNGSSNNPNGNTDEPVIDITPYLGKYMMTRHTELSISVLNMFTFPLDRDLDVEIVTIKQDPTVEHGLIISNNDALYLRGVVDTNGLHLQNDTINIVIDTTIGTFPINLGVSVSMTHPIIQPPVDGKMEWTSVASGSASTTILGMPVSATITGDMRYKTVVRN
ncbi:MAG: hypothetical protein IJM33_03685 [Bacteroidales bacterium]|nr:hypothetical protein [Bacteroidales bacterium]MBR3412460.1 hypothetical protein [Bacteroidales bacterium]